MTLLQTDYGFLVDADNGVVYGKRGRPWKKTNGNGYPEIFHCGLRKSILCHRLIWETAVGEIPKGMEINHINGIKHDNRLCNLELVTHSGNVKHAYRIGLMRADGEFNGRAIGKARKSA